MPFINPLVFWTGLGAVSVPILIHLLNRRRFRVKDWAAMKFLLESIRKNRRRLRIEELILLALRCLAIFLLAMAVSRFTGCSPARSATSEEGGGVSVFILDDSLSMGQKGGAGTLYEAARGDLATDLEGIPASHQVAVLRGCLAGLREPVFKLNLLTDAKGLAGLVRAKEQSDWRINLAEALTAANERFAGATGPLRLYVLSDFRRADLVGEEKISAIKQQFGELRKKGVEVVALDYGRPASSNLTVQDLRMMDKFAVAKVPLRLCATVRNNGSSPASEVAVQPSARLTVVGGQEANVTLPVQMIHEIAPGQEESVDFQVICQEAGPAFVKVDLPADELMEDNTASLAVDVRKFIRVLVVEPQPEGIEIADPSERESFFFCRAVDPKEDGSYGIKPEVVTETGLFREDLESFDAVVLMDLARPAEGGAAGPTSGPAGSQPTTRITSSSLALLEKYVRQGGGLLVFAGHNVDVGYYNDTLWAGGAGLLPLRLGAVTGRGEPNFVRLDPTKIGADASVQTLQGEGRKFLEYIRFFKYISAQESTGVASGEAGAPRVLARFADNQGSPAIVTHTFGRDPSYTPGSVTMIYSTGSTRWNDWPIDTAGTFVITMLETISDLARAQKPQTAAVGQPIEMRLPKGWGDATAVLTPPGYPPPEDVTLARTDPNLAFPVLRYDPIGAAAQDANEKLVELPKAGIYSIRATRSGTEQMRGYFARNPEAVEGDLTPAGKGALQAAFGSEEFEYRQVKGGGDAFGLVEAKAKKEYWKWCIAALVLVLALEIFLGQRFGHYTTTSAGGPPLQR